MIHGSPAIAKSAIVKEVANNNKLKLIDLRLSQCIPEDLLGLASFNHDKTKARYVPFSTFPLESDPIPKGYDGWLLFLDEINSASLSVQSAAFKLVLDRMVGEFQLHERVAIVCAGNKESDKGITNRLSTPMQSRLIHLELEVDVATWLDWAERSEIDHRIISFIKFKNNALHNFDPNHNDRTFPSPRTYEFLSKIIKKMTSFGEGLEQIIEGTIGKGMAREFIGFSNIYLQLPTIEGIIDGSYKMPTDISVLFVISEFISSKATINNISKLAPFINEMPKEYQVIIYKAMTKRDGELLNNKSVEKWIQNNTEVFQ